MAKLNQILAIDKQTKAKAQADLAALYHALQKPALLQGISRVYSPKNEDGEKLPPESGRVQVRVKDELKKVTETLVRHMDIAGAKEYTNTKAKANVVVDGNILLKDVPATYLLFLEKTLIDLTTLVSKIPTLEPTETWVPDPAQNLWATEPSETTRTKKIPRNHVKAEATDKHPAQVEIYTEDVVVGTWKTVKYSSALSQREVDVMQDKLDKLSRAVKFAREEANGEEVADLKAGKAIMDFIFASS